MKHLAFKLAVWSWSFVTGFTMGRVFQLLFLLASILPAQINYIRTASLDRWNDGYATHGCAHGDVNTSVWAADNYVYTIMDDTRGFGSGSPCTDPNSTGMDTHLSTAFARWNADRTSPTRSVNGWNTTFYNMMTVPSYGATFTPDNYSWKGMGITAYNGKIFTVQCWQKYNGVQPSGPCVLVYTSDLINFISPHGANRTPPYSANATMVSATAQNFVITGSNNTLTITIDGGSPQTITLTSGTKTAAQIATNISATLTGATSAAAGGLVTIVSSTAGTNSSVVVSGNAAATFAFPSYTVNGNVTFGRSYRSGVPFFVLYGKGGTAFPSVDNASTYAYFTSCDDGTTAVVYTGNQCRLGSIAWADLDATPFDNSKYYYYNTALSGCTSVSTDRTCWENTDANAVPIISATAQLSMGAPFWVPQQKIAGSSSGRYLWAQWYHANPSGPLHGTTVYYEAPSVVGPWTKISSQSEPEKGFYGHTVWQPSMYDTSSPFITITTSGDWVSATSGLALSNPWNLYAIHFLDLELSTVPFPPTTNFVHLPRSTRFGVAEGSSRASEFQMFYDFAGTATGTTVPDLSGNGHTGTFSSTAALGPGAMSNFSNSTGVFSTGVTTTYARPITVMTAYIHRQNRVGAADDRTSDERYMDAGQMKLSRTSTTLDSSTSSFANTSIVDATMTDYVWHVVYQRWNASGTMDLFDNGVLAGSSAGSTSTSGSSLLSIGGISGSSPYSMNGLVSKFYIRNRAMDDAEIADETAYWQSKMKFWAGTTK